MNRINPDVAFDSIRQEEREFKFLVDLNILTKCQLYLSGHVLKGIEIYGIGPQEIKGFGFMIQYHEIINAAVSQEYRVFVKKEGSYLGNGHWYLEFIKKS